MKHLRVILLLVLILITGLIFTFKPKMHKALKLENPDFQIEETVAWNSWYSKVSNELLSTLKIPAQEATNVKSIYVKFKVDKDGNIEDIATRTEPVENFEIAEKHVIPAVKALQGKTILTFPKGSKRKDVTYTSVIIPSDKTKYTTPSDFKDYEKIK
jgi:hypothetical protein